MKIVYTRHALEKFVVIAKQGFIVNKRTIKETIKNPEWKGTTRENQETALGLIDDRHILRIILDRKNGIIKVITFHLGRRGKYESTL